MVKIELLLAHEDYTWGTEVVEIPDEGLSDPGQWFMTKGPGLESRYRNVVLATTYNDSPDWMDAHSVDCSVCGGQTDEREAGRLYDEDGDGHICPPCLKALNVREPYDEEGFPTEELKAAIAARLRKN